MSISGIDTVSSLGSTFTTEKNDLMGKEDFLHLLVTQLQAQDPLNPMESTDFTAQLAQFSSLEQLQNVNSNMDYLLMFESSINNAQAVSFIGNEIKAIGNAVQVHNDVVDTMNFELHDDAQAVYINVYDNAGNFVRSIQSGEMDAGKQEFAWDGLNDKGNKVLDGVYNYEVLAVDEQDNKISVTMFTEGRVSSVVLKDNATYVVVGDMEVPIGSVVEINEAQESL